MSIAPENRNTAYIIGGAVVLLVLYFFPISPYLDKRAELDKQIADASKKVADDQAVLDQRQIVQRRLGKMRQDGLRSSSVEANAVLTEAIGQWLQECGLEQTTRDNDEKDLKNGYVQNEARIVTFGNQESVAKLLWRVESSPLPVKVTNLSLRPESAEGSGRLRVNLSVATLSEGTTAAPKPGQAVPGVKK